VLSLDDTAHVKHRTGVHSVRPVEALRRINSRIIYTPFAPREGHGQTRGNRIRANRLALEDRWDGRVSRENNFISLLRARHPRSEIRNISPLIDKMRTIKSPREIELLRRAGRLAALGSIEAMKATEPGLYEYQLDAVARYIFLVNGSRLDAYRSITAAGVDNIIDGHYYFNTSKLKAGDLILMDYSPDYGYYVSDIGRMWPVNGKFEPWQRQLCSLILAYHKAILRRIKPGLTPKAIMEAAAEEMEPLIKKTKFLKPYYETAIRKMVKTGGGVFSHTVGMAVHDVGSYRNEPLVPGLVFAVDPQVRVPEENLYMRIEDTIVVTETGIENFTRFAPSELDEIEKMVRKKGMVQKFPPVLLPLRVF
jgi:Xaa-Pro aminopeptidase